MGQCYSRKVIKIEPIDKELIANIIGVNPTACEQCPICLTNIENDLYKSTCCKNCFHESCIQKWNSYKGSCPICRNTIMPELKIDDIKNLNNLIVHELIQDIFATIENTIEI
tara:strand:+ start:320 stop:655 length:336 start_codon:yes stop_codon:yes gene_type:complete